MVGGAVELKPKVMGAEALGAAAAEDPPNENVGDEEGVNEEVKGGAGLGACQLVPNREELVVPLELEDEFVELS